MKDAIAIICIIPLFLCSIAVSIACFSLAAEELHKRREQRKEANHRRMIETLKAQVRHKELLDC